MTPEERKVVADLLERLQGFSFRATSTGVQRELYDSHFESWRDEMALINLKEELLEQSTTLAEGIAFLHERGLL